MPSAYGLGTSKKPYADYDLCPRPMAWAQVKKPYAFYDLCPRPMAWAQVKKPYAFYDLCPRPMAWAQVIIQKKKNPTQIMTRAHGLWPGHE